MYVMETNPLSDITETPESYFEDLGEDMTLREFAQARGQVTRVRIFRDSGATDFSYIHGVLPDGTGTRIWDLPDAGFASPTSILIDWAKSEGVYAKGIGLLNRLNWSVLG